jgi:hypothetical protein
LGAELVDPSLEDAYLLLRGTTGLLSAIDHDTSHDTSTSAEVA